MHLVSYLPPLNWDSPMWVSESCDVASERRHYLIGQLAGSQDGACRGQISCYLALRQANAAPRSEREVARLPGKYVIRSNSIPRLLAESANYFDFFPSIPPCPWWIASQEVLQETFDQSDRSVTSRHFPQLLSFTKFTLEGALTWSWLGKEIDEGKRPVRSIFSNFTLTIKCEITFLW